MASSQPAQVIIFAQAALYRAAWSTLLAQQSNINVAGAVDTVAAVADYLDSGLSTTLFIDVPSPLPPLVQQLQTGYPNLGLLALVDSYDLEQLLPLLRAGVTGCISRDESVADLARAIIAVGRGEIWLPPAIAGRALAALARGESPGGDDTLIEPLTRRETDVLRLLAQGLTNKDIAQTLILSVRTVEAHLRNIFGKLNVGSRTEAALWATRHGYGDNS
jgi:DNA-binding NarL/FixJ family response regulator